MGSSRSPKVRGTTSLPGHMGLSAASWSASVAVAAWLAATTPSAALDTWVVDRWQAASGGEVAADSSGALVLGRVDPGANLALRKRATDHTGATPRITDGDYGRNSAWNSLQEEAFNFFVQVDLEEPHLVDRVVVAPIEGNSTDFMRGYSIQTSMDDLLYDERVLNRRNTANVIDTTFAPVVARYVRVQVRAVDNVHKVQVAELEIHGSGFRSAGTFTSQPSDLGAARPSNLGAVRWEAEVPEGTSLVMQFRTGPTATPDDSWSAWTAATAEPGGLLLELPEPRRYLQYQARLGTLDPSLTPRLRRLEVDRADPLAASATARVTREGASDGTDTLGASEVAIGEESRLRYALRVQMGTGTGFDVLRLRMPNLARIDEVWVGGARLDAAAYRVQTDSTTAEIGFTQPITRDVRVEVVLGTVLFEDVNTFTGELLDLEQPGNPQVVEPERGADGLAATSLLGVGVLARVLDPSRLTVAPNPFSPNGDGRFDVVQVRYDLANVGVPRAVTLRVFDLDGRLVRQLEFGQKSGTHVVVWDGRDHDGRLVPPGLYLFQLDVDSGRHARLNGAIGVAY